MSPKTLRLATAATVSVLVSVLVGCSSGKAAPPASGTAVREQPSAPTAASAPGSPPEHAADFRLTLYEGDELFGTDAVRFSSILAQGRPVVLNFWAGACPPCRREMPDLQEVYDANKDRVLLVGVDGGPFLGLGTEGEAVDLVREMGITYPTGTTGDARIIEDYGVFGMPTTYFIKPNGEVVGRRMGLLTREKLTELVEDLVEKSAAP